MEDIRHITLNMHTICFVSVVVAVVISKRLLLYPRDWINSLCLYLQLFVLSPVAPTLQSVLRGNSLCTSPHDDVIKWQYFPRYWPFVRGIHRSRWIPHTKASDAELWCFFDLRLNKRLNKQSRGWWFETLSRIFWRHRNAHRPSF